MKPRTLSVEGLELREMFAADVTASLVNGNLYINEVANTQNGFDQAVMISSLSNGKVRVTGANSQNPNDPRSTKVNGAAAADFVVYGGIYVNFKDGGDVVKLNNLNAKNVEVNTGGVTWQWPDSDLIEVTGGNFRTMVVNAGIGSDTIKIRDAKIGFTGTGASYLIVNSGDGGDTVETTGLHSTSPVAIQTGNDADVLRLSNNTVHDTLKVDLGAGNDRFSVNATVVRNLDFKAGLGADVGSLDNFYSTYGFNFDMGEGDDTLTARNFDGASGAVDGGAGRDKIVLGGTPTKLGLRNWEQFFNSGSDTLA